MRRWVRIFGIGGLLLGLTVFWASYAGAFSFQASDQVNFNVPLKSLGLVQMPSDPIFFLQGLDGQLYPAIVQQAFTGNDYIVCGLPDQLPLGAYTLLFQNGDGSSVEIPETVRVLAPVIQNVAVQSSKIAAENKVTLQGTYFGSSPTVKIDCLANVAGVSKTVSLVCPVAGNVTNTPDGVSRTTVSIPSLGGAIPAEAVFTVSNKYGTASAVYRSAFATNTDRGALVSWTPHSTPFLKKGDAWKYLVNSVRSGIGQGIVEGILYYDTDFGNQSYKYDLYLWDINYWTVDAFNNPVLASGVVVVPAQKTTGTAPLLSFQHGTMLTKKEAPTMSDGAELGFAVSFAAADGYVVSMMDHQGMGQAAFDPTDPAKRAQLQPYCQGQTLARGAADMMIAIKQFLGSVYPPMTVSGLFLTGYSEGGYATLALQRELETQPKYTQKYNLPSISAVACGDGPYSLAKVMLNKLLANASYPVQYFAPLTMVSMNKTYNPTYTTSNYMQYPYDVTAGEMMNGYFSGDDVNHYMPSSGIPGKILLSSVISDLQAAKGSIYPAFAKNDLAGVSGDKWTPRAKVRLYHGKYDDCVPLDNALEAYNHYLSLNKDAPIQLIVNNDVSSAPFVTWHQWYALYVMGNIWTWFHDGAKL
jgi:hypothetical protein